MPVRKRPATLLLAFTVTVSACTGAASSTSTTTRAPNPATTGAPPTSTLAPLPAVNRLAVIDHDGNVATMTPAGDDIIALTDDAAPEVTYFQPTWSPNAQSIAVSRATLDSFTVMNVDLATKRRSEIAVSSNAFYVYWSPQSDRIGILSNGPDGLGLAVGTFGEEPTSELLDVGAPLYFSWSPDGEQMATLIGQRRLEVRTVDAAEDPELVAMPGTFQNPAWTDNGIYYVRSTGGADQLVLREPSGDDRVLARIAAPAVFTAPASGHRIALQATGEVDGVSASFQQAPAVPVNRLVVLDSVGGELVTVTDHPVLAYFWDTPGNQLLILDAPQEAAMLRWSVWSDGGLRELVEFLPSQSFVQNFLPFFGQYAMSTTMWSPDGTAFAFPGVVAGESGIFVQQVAGGEPRKVASGSWVTWSPR